MGIAGSMTLQLIGYWKASFPRSVPFPARGRDRPSTSDPRSADRLPEWGILCSAIPGLLPLSLWVRAQRLARAFRRDLDLARGSSSLRARTWRWSATRVRLARVSRQRRVPHRAVLPTPAMTPPITLAGSIGPSNIDGRRSLNCSSRLEPGRRHSARAPQAEADREAD